VAAPRASLPHRPSACALASCAAATSQHRRLNPASAARYRYWYQYYRYRRGGPASPRTRDICHLLWSLWSPEWRFDEATFDKTAGSFDNPDFVDVVIQSYRHRYGYAAGDPALAGIEAALAKQPKIAVPTINLHGGHDGVGPAPEQDNQATNFTGPYSRRLLPRIGHNVPQEAPAATVTALRDLMRETTR
jgi:pimeloyl-ACP methyl ester carboxylesterase